MGYQYPPPPPGGYPPVGNYAAGMPAGAGRPAFSATDAFAYGWKGFTANLGPLIVIALVIVAVNLISQWLQYAFDNGFLQFLATIAALLISLVLALGLYRATLIIVDGGTPKVEDVLSTKDLASYIVASVLVWLIVTVGLILCIIPGIIAGYLLQFYGFAILDKKSDDISGAPSSDPVGALRTSFKITSTHVGELLILLILVFVANLIGAILCLVGLLVTIPVSYIAVAYAWRYFTNGTIAPRV